MTIATNTTRNDIRGQKTRVVLDTIERIPFLFTNKNEKYTKGAGIQLLQTVSVHY
jgi:hypothetical protein